jgi:hypothetical protein
MATPPTKAPAVVPIPAGFRRALGKEITPHVQAFARQALGSALPIGKQQSADVDGKLFMALTEWHYDDHVGNPGKPCWHPGISIFTPITPKTKQQVQSGPKTLATGQRVAAYDPFARPGASTDLTTLMENAGKKVV